MKKPTRRAVVVTAVVLLVLIGASLAFVRWASGVSTAATQGRSHLSLGAHALASMDATTAATEFGAASRNFATVTDALGPEGVAGLASSIPWLGRQYAVVKELAGVGTDVSRAGTTLSEALRDASSSSDATDSPHGIEALLGAGHTNLTSALSSLFDAADRASRISTEGLLPPLEKAVDSLRSSLSDYAPALERGRRMLPLLTYIGTDRRILVVSQDGAELRPTGGFAGSYGVVRVGPSGVKLETYHDVYDLPNSGRITPPPGALMSKHFGFRDANWWLDFPTSARSMLGFWKAAGQAPVDGIVAIDTVMMEDVLAVTGPVEVAKFHQTFTADNLLNRLLYLVEIKKVGKGVLSALAQQLEQRVLDSDVATLAKSADALKKAADSKHLQAYLADPAAEEALELLGWSGSAALPPHGTDLLAISNAMTKPGKVNTGMYKTVRYGIGLHADGSADSTLVLTYANTAPFPLSLPSIFRDWLRVYRAPGTVFVSRQRGSAVSTTTEFGLPAEIRTFTLLRGQRTTQTLLARIPAAIAGGGTNGSGPTYRLRVIRQNDLQEVPTTITVTAPPGWRVAGASARYTAPGTPTPVTVQGGRVTLSVGLWGDLELDVRFIKP